MRCAWFAKLAQDEVKTQIWANYAVSHAIGRRANTSSGQAKSQPTPIKKRRAWPGVSLNG
ncbi:hypothetical protein SAMN05216176_103120 [Nitratireductor indicus]|nr:hypothetical protein SAMN05216176_103120 [Nitratireductor indicus]